MHVHARGAKNRTRDREILKEKIEREQGKLAYQQQ